TLYHGTGSEAAFRAILFQGILPSSDGTGGEGLYGVAKKDLSYAIERGGSADRVVAIEISPEARILDISNGHPLYAAYTKEHGGGRESYSRFAEEYGIDILKYPYLTDAFVVKNGGVLTRVQGHTRKLMKFTEIQTYLGRQPKETLIAAMVQTSLDNRVSSDEFELLAEEVERRLGPDEMKRLAAGLQFESLKTAQVSELSLALFDTIVSNSRDLRRTTAAVDLPDWMVQRIELVLAKMNQEQLRAVITEGMAKNAPYLSLVAFTTIARNKTPAPWRDFHAESIAKAESQKSSVANSRLLLLLNHFKEKNFVMTEFSVAEVLKIGLDQHVDRSTASYGKPLELALAINRDLNDPVYKRFFDRLKAKGQPGYLLDWEI
ncbi:MAG: hypothetical protein AAB250_14210, partial [Bdellovibrionota bacterium]